MQSESGTAMADTTAGAYALLQYEVNRVRGQLDTHGELPGLRERLEKLEHLLRQAPA